MTPKRGVVLLTWPIYVCTTVDLQTILLATRRAAINKCAHDGLWLSHLRRFRPPTLRLRPKLHRFVLSPCLLQTCFYDIQTTNRLSEVWALSLKYVLIIDISWSAKQFAINRSSLPGNYTWWPVQYGRFLLCDAMLTQYMPSSCICPSVSVCVCV